MAVTLPSVPMESTRQRQVRGLAHAALFVLPALVLSMPDGLLPFGLALLLSMPDGLLPFGLALLLSSLFGLPLLRQGRTAMGWPLRTLAWLTALLIGFALLSNVLFESELRDVDSRSRFLVLPWTALWAYSLGPGLQWLWRGALAGLFVALPIAVVQVIGGAPRADAFTNAIVFADVLLVMMVLVVLCRPPGRHSALLLVAALLAGCGAIVLSGSRGVWPGVLMLLLLLVWGLRWRSARTRLVVLGSVAALAAVLLLAVPGLDRQMRLLELQSDFERLEQGDVNSSSGARIERLGVAYDSFFAHPFTGVGIGNFDDAMREHLPACRTAARIERCHLGHAHNDVAEWSSAQGIPGLVLLLAVYGLPAWVLLRLHRRSGRTRFDGPAAAGVVTIAGYMLCGLTQSMFAHQVTVSFYAAVIGILTGLATREVHARQGRLAAPDL